MSKSQGLLSQSPEPEAHDKVLHYNIISSRLEFTLIFEERGKSEYSERNLSKKGREPTIN